MLSVGIFGHVYTFNKSMLRDALEEAGIKISGTNPDGHIVKMIEIAGHPHFTATQAHPEFKSRPNKAHPLFRGLVAAAVQEKEKLVKSNRSLKKKLNELESDPNLENNYRSKIDDLNGRVKTFRIASIAAAVLLVGTIAFSAVSVVNSSKLKSQIAEKEQLLQIETKKVEDADKKVIELEEKVTALEEEKAVLEEEARQKKEAQQGNTEQVKEGGQNQNIQEGNAAGEQTENPAEEPVPEDTTEPAADTVNEETTVPAADAADEQTESLNGWENTTVQQEVFAD